MVYHILFIHSPVVGHPSYFQFLATMRNGAMNIHVQVLYEHSYLGYVPRSRITMSYVTSCMELFEKLPSCFPK